MASGCLRDARQESNGSKIHPQSSQVCAQESKGIGEGADDRAQEEVHLKVPNPKVRRDARQLKVLGSFVATHDNVPRKIRAAG